MLKQIINSILILVFGLFVSCREEDLFPQNAYTNSNIDIEVTILDYPDTRGVIEESKRSFQENELLHVRAQYKCTRGGEDRTEIKYAVLKYMGKGKWSALDPDYALFWPNDAVSATFEAYYINGSNGVLTSNTMDPKLLSDYEYGTDPLYGIARDVHFGNTVRLEMKHIFAHLTLTEMNNDVSNEMWFATPFRVEDEPELNNAFYLDFDPEGKIMTPKFTRIPNSSYKDSKGNNLVFIKGETETYDTEDGEVMTRISFFMEPRKYHKFSLLYPRTRTEYNSYLSYNRDLIHMTGDEGMVSNGLYEFSILKSLGVIVEETPDDSWDEDDPIYIIDVEAFLKAAANGQEYWEQVEGKDEKIQILEPTPTGTRLLENIDFHYEYYNMFDDGYIPNLSNTFDGNYHYIHRMAGSLFYQNQGNIINLGIKNARTPEIESNEKFPLNGGGTFDTSYNGLICCKNFGVVRNIRMINAEMNVRIRTSNPDEPTQEAHNAALFFGVNRGLVSNIGISGELKLTVSNAEGETIIPNVMIGGIAGQNLINITGISSIEGDNFTPPEIKIYNKCKGINGVYLIGGITGNNPGILNDIYLSMVTIDSSESSGVESRIGALCGEIPSSNSGSPQITGCIARGTLTAGKVNSLTNVSSLTYIGGLAGSTNIQAIIFNNSVSIGINGSPHTDNNVTYATGGAFGRIEKAEGIGEGSFERISAFGSALEGVSLYKGNFAGIAPKGFGWEHYADKDNTVRQFVKDNVGIEM